MPVAESASVCDANTPADAMSSTAAAVNKTSVGSRAGRGAPAGLVKQTRSEDRGQSLFHERETIARSDAILLETVFTLRTTTRAWTIFRSMSIKASSGEGDLLQKRER